MGFEPTTASLEGWNSTTELRPPLSSSALSSQFGYVLSLSTHHLPASILCGGQARIRTLEADGNRFTVCPLWPLGYLPVIPSYDSTTLNAALRFSLGPNNKKEKQAGPRTPPSFLKKDE